MYRQGKKVSIHAKVIGALQHILTFLQRLYSYSSVGDLGLDDFSGRYSRTGIDHSVVGYADHISLPPVLIFPCH
jgi:hypothetical protein